MKFIDEVTIDVKAGDGGNGLASFRRLKNIPKGCLLYTSDAADE